MDEDRGAQGGLLSSVAALAGCSTHVDVVDALSEITGGDAYIVDHATDHLRRLTDGEQVDLSGPLRSTLLAGQRHDDGVWLWEPLLERRQPVVVVRRPAGITPLPDAVTTVLGPVVRCLRHRIEPVENRRRRSDMSVAAELQWDQLPPRADAYGDLEVAGALEPAYDVAGDLFDLAMTPRGVQILALDGMGHGLDATLSATVAIAAIRNTRRQGGALAEQFAAADRAVFDTWHGDRFVTGVACLLDDERVELIDAGHVPVKNVGPDGSVRSLAESKGLPLGVERDTDRSTTNRRPIEPGGGLVLLSDGAADARSDDGASYGDDAVERSITRSWGASPLLVAHDVAGDVIEHVGDRLSDDLTVVVCRRIEAAP